MTAKQSDALEFQRPKIPHTREIALIGLFSALTIILSVISNTIFKITFVPPVAYLVFDFGEIPAIMCLLIIGPRAGISVALIEWLALNLLPTTEPLIGPAFKFFSVISTLVGLWLGWRLMESRSFKLKFGFGALTASLCRVLVMSIANAALILITFKVQAFSSTFNLILELTAVFNALQIILDFVPVRILIESRQIKHILLKNGMTWFESSARDPTATS